MGSRWSRRSRRLHPSPDDGRNWGRYVAGAVFLAPALFVLGVWVVYPVVYTVLRSFFGQSGYLGTWVGLDNYKRLFTTSTLRTAIKNNAIWVAVVPAFVTSIGLLFAVLLEKIRWKVAFKTVVFLPMAISAFATGVTWRIMYQQDPNLGAVNALTRSVKDVFNPPGVLSQAFPSTSGLQQASPGGAMVLQRPLTPGSVALLGLTGIAPADVPKSAVQAVQPPAKPGDDRRHRVARLQAGRRQDRRRREGRARPAGRDGRVTLGRREDGSVDDVATRRDVRLLRGLTREATGRRSARRPSRSRSRATPGSGRS